MADGDGNPGTPATPGGGDTTVAATDVTIPPAVERKVVLVDADLPLRDGGRYQVEAEHARGGIGRILRAVDRELDRVVAVKELTADRPGDLARFAREIKLTARLEHPGIVPVHDAGVRADDGRPFYTMKLVGGASLRDLVARTVRFDERLVLVRHGLAIADAVAYAHSRGVIHRDLKPSNVMVGEFGETIVIDWGLAKELDAPELAADAVRSPRPCDDVTIAGAVVGTPAFMAPEQARGEPVDERADVYAIGAILYHVLTGCLPYQADSGAEALELLLAGPAVPLRAREPRVPVDLAAIVDKAMAREPADRYPTAQQLASDLRRYDAGRRVDARAYRWWEPVTRWLRRHRVIAALSVAFLIAGAAGLLIALGREQGLRRVAEHERAVAEAARRAAEGYNQVLLEQQARQELAAGHPHRAAPYLAAALRAQPERRVLRWLMSEALAAMKTHVVTLRGHTQDVVTAAFSPDGKTLVTGATDKTVRLWDPATGAERAVLAGHERSLEDVAWTRDGTAFATGDGKGTRIWRADGSLVRALDKGAYRVGFTPDGRQLWGGWHDGRVRAWDVATGADVFIAHAHTDRISVITSDRDGRMVTAAWDGRIVVWDPTGTPGRVIDDHRAGVYVVSFSADGRWVLTGDEEGTLHVRDGATWEVLHTLRLPAASHAKHAWLQPDGATIVTASSDGLLQVWHATSGKLLRTIDTVPEGRLFDAARTDDGELVAVASLRQVDLWRPAAGADWRVLGGGEHAAAAFDQGALSHDGHRLAAPRQARDRSHLVRVWDADGGQVVASWPETGNPYALAISPDGGRIVTGDMDGAPPRLRDATTGAPIATLAGHAKLVVDVQWSRDGAWIATASYDQTVRLWTSDGAPATPVLSPPAWPTAIAFDPAAARIAVADEHGGVTIYDRATGAQLDRFAAHATWIEDLAWSADGRRLITACRQDHTARVWDGARPGGAPPIVLPHGDDVMRAQLSPDGALAATASADDRARVWDATSGELLRSFAGPNLTAAFSPDGTTLYGAGGRDLAVAWRLAVDARPAADVAADAETRSPWRLEGGRLVVKHPVGP